MSQQNPIQEQIIARVMKDDAFRHRLLNNPRETLERELGVTLPQDVTIQVHEDTASTIHLVLPKQLQMSGMQELSDAQLEQAVGGALGTQYTYTKSCCNDCVWAK